MTKLLTQTAYHTLIMQNIITIKQTIMNPRTFNLVLPSTLLQIIQIKNK